MAEKQKYVKNNDNGEKVFLHTYSKAEAVLDNNYGGIADQRDIRLAKLIDVKKMKQIRKANARILQSALSDWLIFTEDIETDCPMFVPVLVPDNKRDALKEHLIRNNIFCPIHWPISKYHFLQPRERRLYNESLSLICDQRYNEKDMHRIASVIKDFWRVA